MIKFEKEDLVELESLVPDEIKTQLTPKQTILLGYFIYLNGLEQTKDNGFFYRSNADIMADLGIKSKPTLISGIRKLESMCLIERKVGIRNSDGANASEYFVKENNVFKNSESMNNNELTKELVDIIKNMQQQITSLTEMMGLILKQQNYTLNYTHQNPLNKGVSDNMGLIDNNKKYTHNYTSDTESDKEKDKINKNNILYKPEEIIKEKEKNIINYIQKEKERPVTENNFEVEEKTIEDKNNNSTINETQTPLEGFASKKEEMNEITKQTPTVEIEKPVEKEIINSINVEKAVVENNNNKTSVEMEIITPTNESAVQYKFMHYDEQLEKFNILIEKLKKCTSVEELTHKHSLMQKYMREHTFLISFLDKAQRTYRELIKNFETPTEKPNKDAVSPSDELDGIIFSPTDFNALEPSTEKEKEKNSAKREREETNEAKLSPTSPSNVLDGIVISPMDLNPTDAKKTASDQVETDIEQAESPNEPFLSPTSPSNDLGGVVDHTEGENPTDAKEMPSNQKIYNPLEVVEKIKAERMQSLKDLIDKAESVDDLRDAAKKVNSLRNSLSTDEMAELAEIMDLKVKYL